MELPDDCVERICRASSVHDCASRFALVCKRWSWIASRRCLADLPQSLRTRAEEHCTKHDHPNCHWCHMHLAHKLYGRNLVFNPYFRVDGQVQTGTMGERARRGMGPQRSGVFKPSV